MRAQIQFAAREEFGSFMRTLAQHEAVQQVVHSVFIDLHPVWKALMDFRQATGIEDTIWPFPSVPMGAGPYDPDSQHELWLRICKHHSKGEWPLLVRLYVAPTAASSESRRAVNSFVRDANQKFPFFIGIEDREPAEFAAGHNVEGGYRITATAPGTLGGFLKDQHGDIWGITCGHVAQMAGGAVTVDINYVSHPNAGTVTASNFASLPSSPVSAPCNPYVASAAVDVDAALLRLNSGFSAFDTVASVGKIDAIFARTQLNSGDTVRMCGAASGAHDYVIGGYGVTCLVPLAGGAHCCFKDAFEIYAPANAPALVPGRLAQAVVPRPLGGDSGAWICHRQTGGSFAYFGNLIAVHEAIGICTFADALTGWVQKAQGLVLQPL
ncbi:MAG TPA: hypothetical protein VGO49_08345 [Bradyrhizobium sp.]|jgi:hypothetical protein|nr:hypothetical protein [Bradyrhizobium sp.]